MKYSPLFLAVATSALLTGCGKPAPEGEPAGAATEAAAATAPVAQPAAAPAPADAAPVTFASLTGNVAAGQAVFNQCKACHAVEAGKNGIGPSLHGVVGRAAGSAPGYSYSPANVASHLTWDPETIFAYLENPAAKVPGTKMAFMLRDPQMRADVIAYLQTLN